MEKNPSCKAGDLGLIPGLERSPGEGNGYLLQYSGLENPMDKGAWWATVHGSQRIGHNFCVVLQNIIDGDLQIVKVIKERED